MNDSPERWRLVALRLEDRIHELHLTKAEVIRYSGVSDKTLAGYLTGEPIRRLDKRRGLCGALGWTADSIERLLRGEEPEIDERALTVIRLLRAGAGPIPLSDRSESRDQWSSEHDELLDAFDAASSIGKQRISRFATEIVRGEKRALMALPEAAGSGDPEGARDATERLRPEPDAPLE